MRIFVTPESLAAGELQITGDEHHYLGRVRRARIGDAVEIVDGAGRRAAATIEKMTETQTTLRVAEPEAIAPKPPHVRALVPLIKGDRMDVCIEKLVEVGVDSIVVWPATRSIVRFDDARREGRLAKYRAAVQAAARQCGRAQVPEVGHANDLATAIAGSCLAGGVQAGDRIVLDPAADAPLVVGNSADVTIASGPEGGLTAGELEQLAAAGFVAVGLGPRVLRAETAPTIAVALIRAASRS
jgi:16S rRNA (uracil1498-N3)-methyltransferase